MPPRAAGARSVPRCRASTGPGRRRTGRVVDDLRQSGRAGAVGDARDPHLPCRRRARWSLPPGRAASTRCSCRCADAATPTTAARSNRAPSELAAQPGLRPARRHHRPGARRRPAGPRLGRGQPRVERGDAALAARTRGLQASRLADGAQGPGRGAARRRRAQPGLPGAPRPLDPPDTSMTSRACTCRRSIPPRRRTSRRWSASW